MACKAFSLMIAQLFLVHSLMASQMHEPSSKAYAIASLAQSMRAELARMAIANDSFYQMDNSLINVSTSFTELGSALVAPPTDDTIEMLKLQAMFDYGQLLKYDEIISQSASMSIVIKRMSMMVNAIEEWL